MELTKGDAESVRSATSSPKDSDSADSVESPFSEGACVYHAKGKRRRTVRRTDRKRGKPTYYIRKDEIGELQDQVKMLQDELRKLKAGSGHTVTSLGEARALTELYAVGIERNNLALAGTQSLLASSTLSMMNGTSAVPLATHIHLPVDAVSRDEILRAMHEPKLRAALSYMNERTRFLDLHVEHHQGHCFDYPNGDAANAAFEVIPFATECSLREVYDEFLFWLRNQEITISEKMGTITIRESEELEDFTYGQSRLLTTVLDDVEIESNLALFTKCHDASNGEPAYAISAIDFVDEDDLYPYRSSELGRKDVTAAILLTEVPTPSGGHVVSMCRWSFIRFRGPTGGINTVQQSAVRGTMVTMCDIMPQLMAERLALRRSRARATDSVFGAADV